MSTSNFALLDTQYGEENKVQQPRLARNTRGPHKYDSTVVNNKVTGYVPVVYEHQEFPRMLYHPEWGAKSRPELAKFAIGCVTAEQYQAANAAFMEAEQKWLKGNRTKLVATAAEEKKLLAKGWLSKPPLRKENPAFDLNSDEL